MEFKTMKKYYLMVFLSAAIAILLIIYYPRIYAAIIAGIPLLFIRSRHAFILGFLLGILVNIAVFLLSYSIGLISKLADTISALTGLPSIVLLIFYPLLFSLVIGISAAIFSEIYFRIKKQK